MYWDGSGAVLFVVVLVPWMSREWFLPVSLSVLNSYETGSQSQSYIKKHIFRIILYCIGMMVSGRMTVALCHPWCRGIGLSMHITGRDIIDAVIINISGCDIGCIRGCRGEQVFSSAYKKRPAKCGPFMCTGGRTRTVTGSPPLDFESSASTNFTTPAYRY